MRHDVAVVEEPATRAMFVRGFVGMLPLWAGAIPVGVAYGVAARGIGLGIGETQAMSLTVFSAAAQVSAVSLLEEGTPTVLLVGTAMALNAQLLLLGLAVGREVRPAGVRRLVAAWLLTDGAYGVASGQGRLRLPALLGAGVSMYLAFNAGTALGASAGAAIPDLKRFGFDLVAPLTFLAVLVPLVRTRTVALVALVAGMAALLLLQFVPGGVAVLGAGVAGSGVGARLARADTAGGER